MEKSARTDPLWWQRGVIYQIYPRSFKDASGDGIGDLPGILEKLDYLSDTLPVDAIWLSPFYPSPMADFGYDVSNYTDVHPMFGTLADFDRLVEAAHTRDLRIIVDFVPNHTSDRHPWFQESRSSRDNPRADWYVWADPKPGKAPPNNWLSFFGGGAWEWDDTRGQYYLHSFLKEQPDLNWRNPAVKHAMLENMRFWLERGVDGFRLDVPNLMMKDPEMRDNPPNPVFIQGAAASPYEAFLHLYDKAHSDIHPLYRDIRKLLDEYSADRPRFAVGEIHEFNWPIWASYYGEHQDELHMPFNFGLLFLPWTAKDVRQVVDGVEAALHPGDWPNYVLGNHDTHRIVSRVGPAQARVAMMLLLTLRGTPTTYYGDEIGMHDVEIPPDRIQDPFEKNVPGLGLGRDPERTPMQWDRGPNAGFCPPDVKPWLPIPDDYTQINVATELDDPRSFLSLTRRLLAIRREAAALHSGTYHPVDTDAGDCFVYRREADEQRYLIALNFSHEERPLHLADRDTGTIAVSTHLDRDGEIQLDELCLRADEGCIIRL
ncbi:MAG TPA: alpha-amylase family glycosyl hydrolase [Chloroflexota bacterium]